MTIGKGKRNNQKRLETHAMTQQAIFGKETRLTLKMRWIYGEALRRDTGATLDELREAATTLEDMERIARRVFGVAHPLTVDFRKALRYARAALYSFERRAGNKH